LALKHLANSRAGRKDITLRGNSSNQHNSESWQHEDAFCNQVFGVDGSLLLLQCVCCGPGNGKTEVQAAADSG
jgi:hypothetical protein